MAAAWEWHNQVFEFTTLTSSTEQIFQMTQLVLPGSSLQRVIVRIGVTCKWAVAATGPAQVPRPADWSSGLYVTDTTGYLRSLANDVWQEGVTGQTVADGAGFFSFGSMIGPYPLVRDITVRKAAPPPPNGELDLHLDVTYSDSVVQGTLGRFSVEHHLWVDMSWLTSSPGL